MHFFGFSFPFSVAKYAQFSYHKQLPTYLLLLLINYKKIAYFNIATLITFSNSSIFISGADS